MEPVFISSQQEWHDWLEKNHDKEKEFQIGFYKAKAKKKGITNKEAVDEALCYGWIDAVVNGIDEYTWTKRFTPRKPNSIWSNVNTQRAKELIESGQMQPAGLKAFEKRDEKRAGIYSFESEPKLFSGEYLKAFVDNKKAWDFFQTTPKSYKTPATHWVLTAKQEATRQKRLEKLISVSEKGLRLDHLTSPAKRK